MSYYSAIIEFYFGSAGNCAAQQSLKSQQVILSAMTFKVLNALLRSKALSVLLITGLTLICAGTYTETSLAQLEQQQEQESNSTNLQSNSINILNQTSFSWNPVNYATISQTNDTLDITVDTQNPNQIYNRAYMQTQLNTQGAGQQAEGQNVPLVLSLSYAAKTLEGNATFVVDVFDQNNQRQHTSAILKPTSGAEQQTLTNERLILENMINKPIEFRLYVITNGPGSHILAVQNATINTNASGIFAEPLATPVNRTGGSEIAALSTGASANTTSPQASTNLPWPYLGRENTN
jgi:hypothetical protein